MMRALCCGLGLFFLALSLHAQDGGVHKDIAYATVDGKALALDLYLPAGVRTPPLVVWVHGGAWRSGTKAQPPMAFVAERLRARQPRLPAIGRGAFSGAGA